MHQLQEYYIYMHNLLLIKSKLLCTLNWCYYLSSILSLMALLCMAGILFMNRMLSIMYFIQTIAEE